MGDISKYNIIKQIINEVAIMPKREEKQTELNLRIEIAIEEEKLREETFKHTQNELAKAKLE